MASKRTKKDIRCPAGHQAGTVFGTAQCSATMCGSDPAAGSSELLPPGVIASGRKPDKLIEYAADEAGVSVGEDNFTTRAQLARLPKGLKGDEAVKWGQDKLQELLPEAVSSLTWDLRYGTQKQRSEAADRVLKANGLDRTEARNQQTGGLIILQLGTSDQKIPWLQRMSQVVTPKDEE